jgi:RNA polymerase sigma factor (sigma-70 family)
VQDDLFTLTLAPHAKDALYLAASLVGIDNAEDIVQESTIKAWRAWKQLRDPSSARSWYLRIVYTTCLTYLKSQIGTNQKCTISLQSLSIFVAASQEFEPGGSVHLDSVDLADALRTLSEAEQQIILLRYFSGFSSTEIGELLEIPSVTVRTKLRRALIDLHNILYPPCTDTNIGVING